MPFFEAIRLALQTIRAQKLKSAFSIVGVFIGVMFLIAVVSVVQGMNRYMTDKFAGTILGVNTFRLRQFPPRIVPANLSVMKRFIPCTTETTAMRNITPM